MVYKSPYKFVRFVWYALTLFWFVCSTWNISKFFRLFAKQSPNVFQRAIDITAVYGYYSALTATRMCMYVCLLCALVLNCITATRMYVCLARDYACTAKDKKERARGTRRVPFPSLLLQRYGKFLIVQIFSQYFCILHTNNVKY